MILKKGQEKNYGNDMAILEVKFLTFSRLTLHFCYGSLLAAASFILLSDCYEKPSILLTDSVHFQSKNLEVDKIEYENL